MVVKFCPCRPHEFQDKKYGQNMRVHNKKKAAKNTQPKLVCTVCGKES